MAENQDRAGQDLAGKVVLVTGASRGIGYAAAIEAAVTRTTLPARSWPARS